MQKPVGHKKAAWTLAAVLTSRQNGTTNCGPETIGPLNTQLKFRLPPKIESSPKDRSDPQALGELRSSSLP